MPYFTCLKGQENQNKCRERYNFPCSFQKSILNFSVLTPLIAFYLLHQLISAKPLRTGVASSFLLITARVCTVMKPNLGKSQNRRKANSFCSHHLHRIYVSPSKTVFQEQYSFTSSCRQTFVSQAKLFSQLVWRSSAHPTQAGN